jgi:hypothetical protein
MKMEGKKNNENFFWRRFPLEKTKKETLLKRLELAKLISKSSSDRYRKMTGEI